MRQNASERRSEVFCPHIRGQPLSQRETGHGFRAGAISVGGVLRLSTLFLRTLRDDPADAEVPSHKLLVRAGYIRRWAPGIYSLLPLGQLVQDNVERVIKEEMDAIGAQQVTFPALLPRDPYETTGRWTEYGDTLFRLKDRRGNDYLLGPTHEELFTLAVKDLYTSYRDFPVILYQIQSKYRDEARPLKAGKADARAIAQLLGYMGDLGLEEPSRTIRGILVAYDFDKRTVSAARASGILLKRYAIEFRFESVE